MLSIFTRGSHFISLTLAIPTILDGGNHTPGFEQSAATIAAHYACLDVTKALAATGVRVILDDSFFAKVRSFIITHYATFLHTAFATGPTNFQGGRA